MTDTAGLIVQGDDKQNNLNVKYIVDSNGDLAIYNVVYAGAEDDTITGIFDNQVALADKYGTQLFGEDGNDTITDSNGADTLSGGNGDDYIVSNSGHDFIDGGDGHDTLQLQQGTLKPNMVTVVNVETLVVTARIAGFDLNQFESLAHYGSYGAISFFKAGILQGPELLGKDWTVRGSKHNDVLDVSTYKYAILISSGSGDDVVVSGMGDDKLFGDGGNDTIRGGAGHDTISGESGDDIIFGGDGVDVINERKSNNTIHGGGSDDQIFIGIGTVVHPGNNADQGSNVIFGDGGNDYIRVSDASSCTVSGGMGNDLLMFDEDKIGETISASGGSGDDRFVYSGMGRHDGVLHGGRGYDSLSGGSDFSAIQADGIEHLYLAAKITTITPSLLSSFKTIEGEVDTIKLSEGGNLIWHDAIHKINDVNLLGWSGADHIDLRNSLVEWSVKGGAGDDVIIGGVGTSILDGGAGNDVLKGHGGVSYLYGGAGDDVFIGGGGLTHMTGGGGNDRFVFTNATGSAAIYHFQHNDVGMDRIDLSKVSDIKDFHDLMKNHVTSYDEGLLITFNSNEATPGEIFLWGISSRDLDASAFIF